MRYSYPILDEHGFLVERATIMLSKCDETGRFYLTANGNRLMRIDMQGKKIDVSQRGLDLCNLKLETR